MTPLAHQLVKERLSRGRREEFLDTGGYLNYLNDFHCFECSEIRELAWDFVLSIANIEPDRQLGKVQPLVFLPASKTWIETFDTDDDGYSGRGAYFCIDNGQEIEIAYFTDEMAVPLCLLEKSSLNIRLVDGCYYREDAEDEGDRAAYEELIGHVRLLIAMLALINTPRIIGRRQHMPHRGLEKKITEKWGVGKFPLHAWTEIKLEVSKPTEIDDGEIHEAHLTGRRALHFCRAHLRLRRGALEYVSPHWRGDPAIGIKQSRYAVTP